MRGGRILLLGVVALIALLPLFAPWSKTFLVLAIAKGLAVLGIVVLLRAGQVSFGHALFFAASAYVAAFAARLMGGGELLTLLVIGALGSGVLGLLVGLFVVRYRYIFFGMLNLAFSMVFYAVLEKFYHYTGGSDGLILSRPSVLGIGLERLPFEYTLFYVALATAAVLGWLVHRYLNSAPGRALAAIKTNETRLEYLGISARGTLLVAYVISAMLAGVGGTLAAVMQGLVTPEYAYWVRSGEFVFIAILGGAGHVLGAFAGALVYEGVRMYLAVLAADMWQLLLGVVLLVIVLFASEGLVGLWHRISGRFAPAGREAS